jgi:hypothetical protein
VNGDAAELDVSATHQATLVAGRNNNP